MLTKVLYITKNYNIDTLKTCIIEHNTNNFTESKDSCKQEGKDSLQLRFKRFNCILRFNVCEEECIVQSLLMRDKIFQNL